MRELSPKSASVVSSLSLYMFQILSLGYSMYIARLFTPEQLGVLSLTLAIIGVCEALKSGGIGDYLIRQKDLSEATVKLCLGVTISFSYFLGALLIVSSSFMGDFFELQELTWFLLLASINFFLSPLVSVNSALLTRDFLFLHKILIDWIQTIVMMVTTVCIFKFTGSIYSLIMGLVLGAVAQLLASILLRSPKMHYLPTVAGFQKIIGFSGKIISSTFVERIAISAPDLIIGKAGAPSDVAFKSKGVSTVNLVAHMLIAGFKPVALPYFSAKDSGNSASYVYATNLVHSISLPIILSLFTFGGAFVLLLFGEQWEKAAAISGPLAIWGTLINIHPFYRQILIVKQGETGLVYRSLVQLASTILGVLVGFSLNGLYGSAIGMACSAFITFAYTHYLVAKSLNISWLTLLFSFNKVFVLTFSCLFASIGIYKSLLLLELTLFTLLCCAFVAMAVVWLVIIFVLNMEIKDVIIKAVAK